jgi:hypothetical protein
MTTMYSVIQHQITKEPYKELYQFLDRDIVLFIQFLHKDKKKLSHVL